MTALGVALFPPTQSPKKFARLAYPIGGYTLVRNSVYYNGHIYVGYIDPDGNLRVVSCSDSGESSSMSPVIQSGLADWHDAPSVLIRSSDNKIIVAFAPHDGTHLYTCISSNAEDVSAWGSVTDIASSVGLSEFTYPMLIEVTAESKLYVFWRTISTGTATWYFSTSSDNGANWATATSLYTVSGKQPYLNLDTDGTRIDFMVGDASSNLDGDNTGSAYHFYYESGNYYTSDGTLIGDSTALPLGPADATKIYDGTTDGGLYYVSCVVTNGTTPRATLIAQDPAGSSSPLKFWYATYSAGWTVNEITADGLAPNYNGINGDAVPDPGDASIVYVAKYGSGPREFWKYETSDAGASWTTTQVTDDGDATQANWSAQIVRNAQTIKAIWLYGPLTPSFSSLVTFAIRGYPNPVGAF